MAEKKKTSHWYDNDCATRSTKTKCKDAKDCYWYRTQQACIPQSLRHATSSVAAFVPGVGGIDAETQRIRDAVAAHTHHTVQKALKHECYNHSTKKDCKGKCTYSLYYNKCLPKEIAAMSSYGRGRTLETYFRRHDALKTVEGVAPMRGRVRQIPFSQWVGIGAMAATSGVAVNTYLNRDYIMNGPAPSPPPPTGVLLLPPPPRFAVPTNTVPADTFIDRFMKANGWEYVEQAIASVQALMSKLQEYGASLQSIASQAAQWFNTHPVLAYGGSALIAGLLLFVAQKAYRWNQTRIAIENEELNKNMGKKEDTTTDYTNRETTATGLTPRQNRMNEAWMGLSFKARKDFLKERWDNRNLMNRFGIEEETQAHVIDLIDKLDDKDLEKPLYVSSAQSDKDHIKTTQGGLQGILTGISRVITSLGGNFIGGQKKLKERLAAHQRRITEIDTEISALNLKERDDRTRFRQLNREKENLQNTISKESASCMEKVLEAAIIGGIFGGVGFLISGGGNTNSIGMIIGASVAAALHFLKRTIGARNMAVLLRAPTNWVSRMLKAILTLVFKILKKLGSALMSFVTGSAFVSGSAALKDFMKTL